MSLNLELSQKQILSQNMIQSMEILQMSTQELESYIENLALENPVIEFPETHSVKSDSHQQDLQRKMDWLESSDLQNKVYYQQERSAEDMEQNWHDQRDMEQELGDYLLSQLLLAEYSHREKAILEFLIQSLDSRGWLGDDTASVADYFSVSEEEVLELLKVIQTLDPAGVGARDLKECLRLQLERREDCPQMVMAIVEEHLDDLAKNHLNLIAKKLQISIEEVTDACELIRSLNPKPGNAFSDREQLRYISPDVVVVKLRNEFEILVNEYQYPTFTINSYYQELLGSTTDEETRKYLSDKIAQAKWVQNCITGRTSTLSQVMHVLVEKQSDFFSHGPGHKRPLRLTDIAEVMEVHESTVSRALKGKYLQCSWGVYPLNYFLTTVAVRSEDDSEDKTPEQIHAMIRQIVDGEDKQKPLSDQAISLKLEELGVKISRRTVNKYRTILGIPDKSGRKQYS